MVSSDDQPALREWLCSRIGLVPTENIQCLGTVNGGRILGVVGFDGYNGASIQMHVAGEPGWLTRGLIKATFDYAFNVCKVNVVLGLIPSGNVQAIRFNSMLGFSVRDTIEGAHPDGSLVLMAMYRRECRYLIKDRNSNGQEISAAATA
jgi:hypothetical protein